MTLDKLIEAVEAGMLLQHRQEQPITYKIVKNGVCSLQHTLYSFVPTNFGSQPARNWICEGSEEYCLEVLNKLQNTNET